MEECVIIGGGVAGLSAANRLADLGMSALLIEGGEYPAHRICGEYFSHECLPILDKWEIGLSRGNDRVRIIQGHRKVEFQCPNPAWVCSRYDFDKKLFDRALSKGARALCNTKMQSMKYVSGLYELQLSNGELIKTHSLFIGTGKLGITTPKYFGYKAHFKNTNVEDLLEMHLVTGGYYGVSKIDHETINVAALMSHKVDPRKLFKGSMVFAEWLEGRVPEFGIRNNPEWENVYWIGDAAGGIPPICGQGLAIGITSGYMAADYLMDGKFREFRKDWRKRYQKRFFWAQQIHRILMQPRLCSVAMSVVGMFPGIPLHLWKLTRE